MKSLVTLDSKELRAIVAKALRIPIEKVIQQRYSIAIEGFTTEQVAKMLNEIGIQFDE